ncbi:uncharacterized protein TNCT_54741 [Trichonephila clavata]|uniref:Uncharacterized protein n=1 Tax=Trichonephila clavata TaxID=2740835 RepID=A0A8X6FLB0_TRICU|nr:uncharacterized protein TNCT_54741 [Trichonephila clavata]
MGVLKGKDCTFEKMEQVREQQERLARLHFELNTQQEIYGPQSEDGRRVGRENLGKLIENLQQLSRILCVYDVFIYTYKGEKVTVSRSSRYVRNY